MPLFLKRQRDRTLGGLAEIHEYSLGNIREGSRLLWIPAVAYTCTTCAALRLFYTENATFVRSRHAVRALPGR